MKIIASPANYNEAISLIDNGIDVLLLGDSIHSTRMIYNCQLDDLNAICNNKKQTEIWLNVNAFFYEQDLDELEKYLKEIKQLKIDKVVFNDYAVAQIDFEQNLNLNLHYEPSALVTSYGQLEFYLQNNIHSVSLSNELFLPEILTILKNKPKGMKICLQVQGFVLIMHSRWNLVTNFAQYLENSDDEYIKNKAIFIREEQRKYKNIIFEDNHGTHMFSGYELCLIRYLKKMLDAGLEYIKIDNILQTNNEYSLKYYKIYQKLINSIKNNNFDEKLVENLIFEAEEISTNELAAGFVGGIKEIKHYEDI